MDDDRPNQDPEAEARERYNRERAERRRRIDRSRWERRSGEVAPAVPPHAEAADEGPVIWIGHYPDGSILQVEVPNPERLTLEELESQGLPKDPWNDPRAVVLRPPHADC
jgi:hypothetical protein